MSTAQFIIILCLTILVQKTTTITAASDSDSDSTIYDALTAHGLPQGLVPKGVTNYTLESDGRFVIHLDQACNAKFESELHYDRNVTGRLSYGKIANLTGISAQELFLWFPVRRILVDVPSSGLIYFDVGVVLKQFSLSLFDTPPECVAGALFPDREEEVGGGPVEDDEVIMQVLEKKPEHSLKQEESGKQSM